MLHAALFSLAGSAIVSPLPTARSMHEQGAGLVRHSRQAAKIHAEEWVAESARCRFLDCAVRAPLGMTGINLSANNC